MSSDTAEPVTPEEFEQLVIEALDQLPDWVIQRLENVLVQVEEILPGRSNVLGLYVGVPRTRRSGEPLYPDRITIYRQPIMRVARTPDKIREQVRITVLHEVGHHFGMDEEALRRAGYG